jgi:hypothetical protein
MSTLPKSIDDTLALLARADYVAERSLATAVFLALKMGRPLFLEGEAGAGTAGGLAVDERLRERRHAARVGAGIGRTRPPVRCPGLGGSSGPPAKHCAIAIHRVAVSPTTRSLVSAILRPCVTTWQNSLARPSTRLSSLAGFHSQISPEGAVRRT